MIILRQASFSTDSERWEKYKKESEDLGKDLEKEISTSKKAITEAQKTAAELKERNPKIAKELKRRG